MDYFLWFSNIVGKCIVIENKDDEFIWPYLSSSEKQNQVFNFIKFEKTGYL